MSETTTSERTLDAHETAEIFEKRREIKAAAIKLSNLKARYGDQKKLYEGLRTELDELIDDFENPTPRLPLKDAEPDGHTVNPDVPVLPDTIALKYDPDTDLRWRDVPLKELDLSEALRDKLEAVDIFTVGHLVDWQKTTPLDSIKGIGETAAGKIADATEKFWGSINDRFPPAAQAPAEPSDDDTGEHATPADAATDAPGDDDDFDDGLSGDELDDEADLDDDDDEAA